MILEFHLKTQPSVPFLKSVLLIDHTKIKQIYIQPSGNAVIEDESGQMDEITETAEEASAALRKARAIELVKEPREEAGH